MRKFTLIALLFYILTNSATRISAQTNSNYNQQADIIMQDGTIKKGSIFVPINMSTNSVKMDINGTVEKINVQDIDKITYSNNYPVTYYSMPYSDGGGVKSKKKLMLASLTEGKVKLYTHAWASSNFRPVYNMQALNTPGVSYYCKRDNEMFATLIALDDGNSINRNSIFKKRAIQYFGDNEILIEKIKNKEYKFTDVFKVVLEYNGQ